MNVVHSSARAIRVILYTIFFILSHTYVLLEQYLRKKASTFVMYMLPNCKKWLFAKCIITYIPICNNSTHISYRMSVHHQSMYVRLMLHASTHLCIVHGLCMSLYWLQMRWLLRTRNGFYGMRNLWSTRVLCQ